MAEKREATAKFDKGMLVINLPVDPKAVTISTSGKSAVMGGATIRDVNVGGELVRVSVSCYVPIKAKKAAASAPDKPRMTLAEARKLANSGDE